MFFKFLENPFYSDPALAYCACIVFCHGHGFFGVFRSVEDLFTSAYNTGSQAVTQEANL